MLLLNKETSLQKEEVQLWDSSVGRKKTSATGCMSGTVNIGSNCEY